MSSEAKKTTSGFLKQGSILAATSIIVRIIGLVYRIPMANIIGDEGNGIYSAAYEIYNILLIISSYGMPMAVSKMVSAKLAEKRYRETDRIFRCSVLFSACTGGIAALIVFFGADFFERTLFSKYTGIAIPLRILAPTIFIVAVMGVLRGFFQGRGTMIPTAFSQVIEQIVNAVVSVSAAWFFIIRHSASKKMPAYGAAGGTLGTCLGALSAFVVMVFIYLLFRPVLKRQAKRDKRKKIMSFRSTFGLILWTMLPIVLSQTVYQLSGIVDITLFNGCMSIRHFSAEAVSTASGIYSTKYRLLVSVPIAVSTAIASSMIPSLVKSFVSGDRESVNFQVNLSIKFNMIIAIPSAFGFAVLGEPIIRLLFPSSDYKTGGLMMLLGSTCIIFYALSTVTSGVLQAIDQMRLPVFHSLASLIVHVALVAVLLLITPLGIYALVIGNVTYPLVVCILNAHSVYKYLGLKQEKLRTLAIPVAASAVMSVAALAIYLLLFKLLSRVFIPVVLAVAAAVFVYFALILKMGSLSRQELFEFPFGRSIYKLAVRLHIMKKVS